MLGLPGATGNLSDFKVHVASESVSQYLATTPSAVLRSAGGFASVAEVIENHIKNISIYPK